jgi:hypothetical protein
MFRWGGLKGVIGLQRCPPPLEVFYIDFILYFCYNIVIKGVFTCLIREV